MQVGQLANLAVGEGAALALGAGGLTSMPHVKIDDQKPSALEDLQQRDRSMRAKKLDGGSTSTIGRRLRAAAIASPSRVCAFSRTRSLSSSVCQAARSTTAGSAEVPRPLGK